jgi:hypothetical protein
VQALVRQIEQEWGISDIKDGVLPPWRQLRDKKGKSRYATIWEDLYEVCDLLPRADREPSDVQDRLTQLAAGIARKEAADAS